MNDVSAQVQVKTHVKNEYAAAKNCTVRTYIVDANNTPVAQMADTCSITAGGNNTFTQLATVTSPLLWHPNHPNLYTVYTEVYDDNNAVDTYKTMIGIRSISFSRTDGFKINGQRLMFRGTNRMQDFPYVGYAMTDSEQVRDAVKLKEAGFQCIRTSQYPQSPAFLEACDELGLMVMNPVPGFQYDDNGNSIFYNRSYQNMRDMIRRDRNHPCVIVWELSLNETWFTNSYAINAMIIGHAEYPGNQCYVAGWKNIGYSGDATPVIYDVAFRNADHNPSAWDYTGPLPLVINEYGHWRYTGYPAGHDSDVDRKEGESPMLAQARNHMESLNNNRGVSFLSGDALWVGIDYACYPSGVLDNLRIPKFSYYFHQSQRDPNLIIPGLNSGPMVFIGNYWTASSPSDINVFSNCDQVKLYRNGTLVATQSPDSDINTIHLPHPPFTFRGIAFQSGELKAEGYIGGQLASTHIVKTPGTAVSLDIKCDLNSLKVGGDITFVYVSVLDANGTIVPTASNSILLTITGGPATIVSQSSVAAEAGTATFLLRSTTDSGQITVQATASGLTSDTASIASQ